MVKDITVVKEIVRLMTSHVAPALLVTLILVLQGSIVAKAHQVILSMLSMADVLVTSLLASMLLSSRDLLWKRS